MKDVALEPCPACQEPVHPVAGRCKHCRADLVALRAEALAAHKRAAAAARAAAATPLRISRLDSAGPTRVATSAPSSASRKLVLAAAAVLLAGVAGGVVAQKLYARNASAAGAPAARHALAPAAAAPGAPPPWSDPFGAADPDPAPNAPRDPSFPFADPFDFGGRGGSGGSAADPFGFLRPRAPSQAPPRGQRSNVSDVQDFLPAMVDAVCAKLAQCGVVDDAMAGMCRMMSESLVDEETVERVRRGECKYDAAAAGQCLQAVGGMTCDSAADPGQLLALADQLSSCSRTLECR